MNPALSGSIPTWPSCPLFIEFLGSVSRRRTASQVLRAGPMAIGWRPEVTARYTVDTGMREVKVHHHKAFFLDPTPQRYCYGSRIDMRMLKPLMLWPDGKAMERFTFWFNHIFSVLFRVFLFCFFIKKACLTRGSKQFAFKTVFLFWHSFLRSIWSIHVHRHIFSRRHTPQVRWHVKLNPHHPSPAMVDGISVYKVGRYAASTGGFLVLTSIEGATRRAHIEGPYEREAFIFDWEREYLRLFSTKYKSDQSAFLCRRPTHYPLPRWPVSNICWFPPLHSTTRDDEQLSTEHSSIKEKYSYYVVLWVEALHWLTFQEQGEFFDGDDTPSLVVLPPFGRG